MKRTGAETSDPLDSLCLVSLFSLKVECTQLIILFFHFWRNRLDVTPSRESAEHICELLTEPQHRHWSIYHKLQLLCLQMTNLSLEIPPDSCGWCRTWIHRVSSARFPEGITLSDRGGGSTSRSMSPSAQSRVSGWDRTNDSVITTLDGGCGLGALMHRRGNLIHNR